MDEIYKNTPENKAKFDEFWNDVPEMKTLTAIDEEKPKCEALIRETIRHIDRCKESGMEKLSIDYVRTLFKECLRGR